MNGHKNYGKIHRLGKEETEGILIGDCVIQEKVDGANASIWIDDEGKLKMGTRTRVLPEEGDDFNGFVTYVRAHTGIQALLTLHPNYRLFGEWLVKHTVEYKATVYRKFYLFDIWVHEEGETGRWISSEQAFDLAFEFQIEHVPNIATIINPTIEQIQEFVGRSKFGDRGEGIVIKNYSFVNQFGDTQFAKLVTPEFVENNAIAFGGNNKYSESYHEMWVVNKYMTLARVQKMIHKLQPTVNERLDMKHIPMITNNAYRDMLIEEIWEIARNVPKVDFKVLTRIAQRKAKQIFVDILNDSISIADNK